MLQPKEINPRYLLSREKWEQALEVSKSNPAYMMRAALDYLSENTNKELDFVDVSNPSTLLMEFSATLAANNFNHFSIADKKHYPILSSRIEDLYPHMSDELYKDRFATPSQGTFQLIFKTQQILNNAVETGVYGLRKLILPRGSIFQVDGINYTLLTAIEIRVSAYNAIQVVYDTTEMDPFQQIKSNILEYYYIQNSDNESCLAIEVPLYQIIKINKKSDVSHIGNIYHEHYQYPDKFMGARVYVIDKYRVKREIRVIYSDSAYDVKELTARIKVLTGNVLKVEIPVIYYNNKLLEEANVQVEIYTTKGKLNLPLKSLTEDFSLEMNFDSPDIKEEESQYIAPLSQMDFWGKALTDSYGGKDEIDFLTLKRWVVEGGHEREEPITHANIKVRANRKGYDIVTDVDNLTNRIFQATKEIENNRTSEENKTVGCTIESVMITKGKLRAHPSVKFHEDTNRTTILPTALYQSKNGRTTLLYPELIPSMKLGLETFLSRINSLEYVYSPFHYVLDESTKDKELRAYYLDKPTLFGQNFIAQNHNVEYLAAADFVEIIKTDYGFQIQVITRGSDSYKEREGSEVFAQLSFIPKGQIEHAYITGTWEGKVDGNHLFSFDIHTDFDFDKEDDIIITNAKIISMENRKLACKLFNDFHVVFGLYDLADNEGVLKDKINERMFRPQLDTNKVPFVIAENTLKIRLGSPLTHLWRNLRTVKSSVVYERYEQDIPLYYTEPVYRTDEQGLPIINESGSELEFEYLHRIGDPVLNEQGEPIYLHRQGDVKLNAEGKPIIKESPDETFVMDLLFLDGVYYFATNKEDRDYIEAFPEIIVEHLDNDLGALKENLMEMTDLYFLPKRTMGYVKINAENNIMRSIFNRLPFRVKLYLTNRAYNNLPLRESLTKMIHRTINDSLKERVISKDIIEQRLRVNGGENNILGVNIIDMGVGENTNTFSMVNNNEQCAVRRKLVLLPDGKFKVKEDISIEFINHEGEIKDAN